MPRMRRAGDRPLPVRSSGEAERTRLHEDGLRVGAAVVAALVLVPAAHAHRLPRWWINEAECVHRHEGSWRDPGAPYWGGMQMDWDFMATYGPWALRHYGPANNWPRWLQLHVAFKGWKARGWWPWPNTARYCGLL